ncbi:hypothetical protein AB205_0152450 [Aquarana catesbeiana]|uniref:SCAN box domain-containing protein n=1 Tax=Aquarana catesbeiana TaxID=8400 RepID=A0A2G9QGH3_AQUCT|nr:hypothetical protein AB205_0152450 [Aquarana catesbeiana]
MEAQYEWLKRFNLKDLLENRGRPANNRKKRDIIAELVEMDGAERPSVTDRTPEEASFDRAVNRRLAHYGPNPRAEIIDRVISAVKANWLQQKEKEIDGYHADFERQCALNRVLTEEWVTILSGKLSGWASEAFRAIPDEEIMNYGLVKEALLARYAIITPEAYQRRFRELSKQTGDSYTEWACLHRTASHWVAGCQAVSREGVLQLFLLEHFFDKLSPEVREWVRDRKPFTLPEAARLADEYTDAHKLDIPVVKTTARVDYQPAAPSPACAYQPKSYRPTAPPPAATYSQQPRFNSQDYSQNIRCFQV